MRTAMEYLQRAMALRCRGGYGYVAFRTAVTMMGDFYMEAPDLSGKRIRDWFSQINRQVCCRPDVCSVCGGDHAFPLCTDGFWEYVEEREMADTLGHGC